MSELPPNPNSPSPEEIPSTTTKSSPPSSPNKTRWGIILTVVVLLIIIALAVTGLIFLWQQYQSAQAQANALQENVWRSENQICINTLEQTRQKTAEQQQLLHASQQELQQCKLQAQKKMGNWPLIQADNLIKLAAFNLQFNNNFAAASVLLQAADQQLQTDNDSSLWPLRQALAADITAIKAVPKVDVAGILFKLSTLSRQIEQLPQVSPLQPVAKQHPAAQTAASHSVDWEKKLHELGEKIQDALKTIVVIHYPSSQVAPLLPPDQYVYVITNIQAQIALAQWAVLHQQQKTYQQSLQLAKTWIQRYFDPHNTATVQAMETINNLEANAVNPTVPDINRSLKAAAEAMQKS